MAGAVAQRDERGRFVKGHAGYRQQDRHKVQREARERVLATGCNPLEALVRVGRKAEDNGELAIAAACYKELASYCYPKPRPPKDDGDVIEGRVMVVSMVGAERDDQAELVGAEQDASDGVHGSNT